MTSRWLRVTYAVEGRSGLFARTVEVDGPVRAAGALREHLERVLAGIEGRPVGVGRWEPARAPRS